MMSIPIPYNTIFYNSVYSNPCAIAVVCRYTISSRYVEGEGREKETIRRKRRKRER